VAALAQITRDSSGLLVSISTPKINVSNETVDAFVAEGRYVASLGRFGNLEVQLAWNDMLKHTNQIYPGDPTLDALRDPTWSTDFKSKTNATVTWSAGDWSATLYVERYGSTPNYLATIYGYGTPGAGTLSPWTTANIGARYQWTPQLQLSVNLVNAFDAMPPEDRSYPGTAAIPYNVFNYNVYGRSVYVGAQYKIRK
jgi:iron complex outermembrane receptor protein